MKYCELVNMSGFFFYLLWNSIHFLPNNVKSLKVMFRIYAFRIKACMLPKLNGCLQSWPTLVCCMMVFSMLCSWSGSIGASLLYTKTKFIIVLQSKTTTASFSQKFYHPLTFCLGQVSIPGPVPLGCFQLGFASLPP